ncbi:MAG TPA: MFS transporter [Candidatus Ruminococcus avistercoris]|nr:MFS transporter [Candidatus Ruminococcus avistercoris]
MKKLSTLVKWSFVLPTLGQNLFIYLELYYMSYFLTDICQFPLNTVTFILTSTAAVDLVWVFVTGIVLEKCDFKKMGKYRAWYVIGSPIIILFFALMFTDFGNSAAAMAVVVVSFCIKTLFQDIQSAAVTAQLSQISDSQQERTTLSVTRNIGSVAGQLLFSFVGVATITFFGNVFHVTALGYTAAAIIFTIVNGICHIALYYITKDVPVAKTEEKKEKLSVGRMFKIFVENPPLLILSFGDLLRYTAYFLISSTAAYYFAAVLKDSASMSIYLTAQTCMGVVAALVVEFMIRAMGKKATYVLSCLMYGGTAVLMYFIGGEGATVIFIVVMSIGSFFNNCIRATVTAMTADTVIYSMWKSNTNARGFIMSMTNIPIKFGSMIKSVILPVGLSIIGYQAGVEATPEVAQGIAVIMCLVAGGSVVVSGLINLFFYSLTEKRVDEMTQEINERM